MTQDGQQERSPIGAKRSSDSAPDRLRLTDFEAYMLLDDRPSHPMVITMALHIHGDLNRKRFCEACANALENHLLLRSVVVGRGRKLEWRSSNVRPKTEWVNESQPSSPPVPYIDLRKSIGIRTRVEWTQQRSVVYFFLHHACCDGISALRFIADVLAHYATMSATKAMRPSLPAFRTELLPERSPLSAGQRTTVSLRQFVKEVAKIVLRGSANLRSSRVRIANKPNRSVVTRTLPRSSVRELRQAANRLGVTTNDLCASEFACVLADWNKAESKIGAGPLRLILPLSLRQPEHDEMPATNCISYLPIEFSADDATDADSLARRFHARTTSSLASNFGLVFLKTLALGRRIPGALPWFVGLRRRLCTAVFANVGDVRRSIPTQFPQSQGRIVAGDIRVDRIDGVAPIRPNTAIAISIGTYAGDLIVNMQADPAVLSNRDADALLDSLMRRLESRCHRVEGIKVAA